MDRKQKVVKRLVCIEKVGTIFFSVMAGLFIIAVGEGGWQWLLLGFLMTLVSFVLLRRYWRWTFGYALAWLAGFYLELTNDTEAGQD